MLHHIFHPFEATEIGLVEVLLLCHSDFLHSRRHLYRLDFRIGLGLHQRVDDASAEHDADSSEENLVYNKQRNGETDGADDEDELHDAEKHGITNHILRQRMTTEAEMRNENDVEDISETQQKCNDAQQNVRSQEMVADVRPAINPHHSAAGKHTEQVKAHHHDSGRGIAHHSAKLQISGHEHAKRVDAEQETGDKQEDEHKRVEHTHVGDVLRKDEERQGESINQRNEHQHPSLGLIGYAAAGINKQYDGHGKVAYRHKFRGYKKIGIHQANRKFYRWVSCRFLIIFTAISGQRLRNAKQV